MKRSVIIAKCIGLSQVDYKVSMVFDKPLHELCSKFVLVTDNLNAIVGTLTKNDIIEIDYEAYTKFSVNKYYRIIADDLGPNGYGWIKPNDYKEETLILWHELGSLIDPTIETIDLYIKELNFRN